MEFSAAYHALSLRSVLTATAVSYFFMALWYSPFVFGARWTKASHLTGKMLRRGNIYMIYASTLMMNLFAAFILGIFLTAQPGLKHGAIAGFGAGFFWVGMFMSIIYTFERRPLPLYLIDGGFVTCSFTIMGAILGGWNYFF